MNSLPFDGGSGNLLSRTEPKVRAASVTALLVPVALYYLDKIPAVHAIPGVFTAILGALVTGALSWLAGYLAQAVHRVDLVLVPELARERTRVERVAAGVVGQGAVDEVEAFIHGLSHSAEEAATAVLTAAEAAAAAGSDPLVAARAAAVPAIAGLGHEVDTLASTLPYDVLAGSLSTSVAAAAPVTSEIPAQGLPPVPGAADQATPIADAVAADTPVAVPSLPPVPGAAIG